MATRNIVPRATGEGQIGTSAKTWNAGYFNDVAVTNGVTASTFTGDLTGDVTGDVTGNVTGATSVAFTTQGEVGFRDTTHTEPADICKQLILSSTDINHWGDEGGAKIALHSYDSTGTNTSEDGAFSILATNGTDSCELKGKPNGSLTWNAAEMVPVGVVQAFAGSNTPAGWLLCDGSAVSRTTYAALFAVIGTTYGAGNGSTTFNLPNLVDKFIQGNATSGTAKAAGLPNIVGTIRALKVRSTNSSDQTGALYGSDFQQVCASDGTQWGWTKLNLNAGSWNSIYGNSTTVQPPALTMRYIIKY